MMDIETLKKAGIDYDSGIRRILDDRDLYESMLTMFLDDDHMAAAGQALAQGDYHELFEHMHALKGVCGNLDMKDCYQAASVLTELVRPGKPQGSPEQIAAAFAAMKTAYDAVMAGIRAAGR